MATKVVTMTIPAITEFYPAHTRGDKELHGNPKTHLEVALHRRGQEITLSFYVSFVEEGGDHTTFQGGDHRVLLNVNNEFPGWTLDTVGGNPSLSSPLLYYAWDGYPQGHGYHHYNVAPTGLVREFTLLADSDGGIFGGDDHPGIISLLFNQVPVQISKPDEASSLLAKAAAGLIAGRQPTKEDLEAIKKAAANRKVRDKVDNAVWVCPDWLKLKEFKDPEPIAGVVSKYKS